MKRQSSTSFFPAEVIYIKPTPAAARGDAEHGTAQDAKKEPPAQDGVDWFSHYPVNRGK
jgi:hypothetical protein